MGSKSDWIGLHCHGRQSQVQGHIIKDSLLAIVKSSVFCVLIGKFTTCSIWQLSTWSINLSFSCFGYWYQLLIDYLSIIYWLIIDLNCQSISGKLKYPPVHIRFFLCMLASRFISSKGGSLISVLGGLWQDANIIRLLICFHLDCYHFAFFVDLDFFNSEVFLSNYNYPNPTSVWSRLWEVYIGGEFRRYWLIVTNAFRILILHAFFKKKTFKSNARLKLAKNQATTKQHPTAELLVFKSY